MRVGLSVYDMPPAEIVALAEAADELGFDTIWLGEHLLTPIGYASEHPTHGTEAHQHHTGPIVDAQTELVDPLVVFGAAAARTTRLRLATGIYLLPLRHPLLTARAAMTLQELAGGRFLLGVGAGWLREEFDALDVPFSGRGRRVEESIAVLRAAWRGEPFTHDGELFHLAPMQLSARPATVPIVCGGNSQRAVERAAAIGDAWFSSGTPTLDEARALVDRLHALRRAQGSDAPFPCYVRIGAADPDLVARYRDAGIEDVVVWADQVWRGDDLATKRSSLAHHAAALLRY